MKANKSKKIILSVLLIITLFASIAYLVNKKEIKTKVLLIGLDGADWKVITPLLNRGKLPNIKILMDKGSWGNLNSPEPITSEVIWTSIATGKTHEEHGITDRLMKDPDTRELVPPTSNLRKVKAIWNILSEHKNKVGAAGYMVTWPPEEVHGVMISNRADQHKYSSKDYSYPPFSDLCNELEFNNFSKVENSIVSRIEKDKFTTIDLSIEKRDNFIANFSKHLLQKQNFDFFCLHLWGIDILSHYFWKYSFPEGFDDISKEDLKKNIKI